MAHHLKPLLPGRSICRRNPGHRQRLGQAHFPLTLAFILTFTTGPAGWQRTRPDELYGCSGLVQERQSPNSFTSTWRTLYPQHWARVATEMDFVITLIPRDALGSAAGLRATRQPAGPAVCPGHQCAGTSDNSHAQLQPRKDQSRAAPSGTTSILLKARIYIKKALRLHLEHMLVQAPGHNSSGCLPLGTQQES